MISAGVKLRRRASSNTTSQSRSCSTTERTISHSSCRADTDGLSPGNLGYVVWRCLTWICTQIKDPLSGSMVCNDVPNKNGKIGYTHSIDFWANAHFAGIQPAKTASCPHGPQKWTRHRCRPAKGHVVWRPLGCQHSSRRLGDCLHRSCGISPAERKKMIKSQECLRCG